MRTRSPPPISSNDWLIVRAKSKKEAQRIAASAQEQANRQRQEEIRLRDEALQEAQKAREEARKAKEEVQKQRYVQAQNQIQRQEEIEKDDEEKVVFLQRLQGEDQKAAAKSEECSLCMENKRCVLFRPCKHCISCIACTKSLVVPLHCPTCRMPIDDAETIFL